MGSNTSKRRSSIDIPLDLSGDKSPRLIVFGNTGPHQYCLTESILQKAILNLVDNRTTLTIKTTSRNMTVVNTPNLNNPDISPIVLKKELRKAVCYSCPGPHVVIFTLGLLDVPSNAYNIFKPVVQHFGEAILKHTMVVLYHEIEGDCQSLVDIVRNKQDFRELLERCGQKCFVFDGKANRKDGSAATQLLKDIEQMVSKHGKFSNQEFEEANKRIKKEEQFIEKEREKEVRQMLEALEKMHSGDDLDSELKRYKEQIRFQNRERAEGRVADKLGFTLRLVDYAVAIGKGALVGVVFGIALGGVGTALGASVGAVLGGVLGGAARAAWQEIAKVFTRVHRDTA